MSKAYSFSWINMFVVGNGQVTLYPLGDNLLFGSFSNPPFDPSVAMPQLTFSSDNSNVHIEWYWNGVTTCNKGNYGAEWVSGTLPRIGTDAYTGQLAFTQCDGNQWRPPIEMFNATISIIDNPV